MNEHVEELGDVLYVSYDDPFYLMVYRLIRTSALAYGTWTSHDEDKFQAALLSKQEEACHHS